MAKEDTTQKVQEKSSNVKKTVDTFPVLLYDALQKRAVIKYNGYNVNIYGVETNPGFYIDLEIDGEYLTNDNYKIVSK